MMYAPNAGTHYILVSMLMHKGGQILFKDQKLHILIQGQQIAKGYQEGNLFWIDTSNITLHAIAYMPISINLWHKHMGHMSIQAL
jgi:hypothetical protein